MRPTFDIFLSEEKKQNPRSFKNEGSLESGLSGSESLCDEHGPCYYETKKTDYTGKHKGNRGQK